MAEKKRILVVSGTGYLGQHLLTALSSSVAYHTTVAHHRPTPPPDLLAVISPALAFRVDLQTGDGFDAISHAFGQPDFVINCAAISAPRACEMDPEAAMGTNVPSSLVNWLARLDRGGGGKPLLIHLSTDQGSIPENHSHMAVEKAEGEDLGVELLVGGEGAGFGGKEVQRSIQMIRMGWNLLVVATYAKCGDLVTAKDLFDEMPEKDVVSWSLMISGYAS